MNSYTFIQPDLIKSNMFGDEQMIKTFIGMYLTHCRSDFDNLIAAVHRRDVPEIGSKAHHMKPTMSYIGARELHVQFQEVESAARNGTDVSIILSLFEHLERNFEVMMRELDHFYSTLS